MLKLCSTFLTLWLLGFLLLYYRRKFEHLKTTNALLRQDTLLSSGLLVSLRSWSFVPEALLCLVHAPPFVCAEVAMPYYDLRRGNPSYTTLNTDELAAVVMMFARASLLVRWLPYIGGLAQRQNRAYANLNHLNISGWLSVRAPPLRLARVALRGLRRAPPPRCGGGWRRAG